MKWRPVGSFMHARRLTLRSLVRLSTSMLLLIGTATCATANADELTSFQGRWSDSSDPKACEIPLGYGGEAATTYLITPKGITYYEIDCTAQDIFSRPSGVDLNIDCFKGGGIRWFEKLSIRRIDQDRITLRFSKFNTAPLVLHSCPNLPDDSDAQSASDEASSTSEWTHNGSVVSMSDDGSNIEIDYLKPRSGLNIVGVRTGTMLFWGSREGHKLSGKAYLFDRICGPVAYDVSGEFSSNNHRLIMSGMAPRTDAKCDVKREFPDSLIFDRMP